jgi:TPR repeat protein
MPKGCFLCRLLVPVIQRHLPYNPEKRVWAMSKAWDSAQSNKGEILEREADRDGLMQAFDLSDSNPRAAFQLWLDLAGRGSVWSMHEVAMYYSGRSGFAREPGEAEKWSRRGFEAGDQRALLQYVGIAMERGDFATAEAILQRGVDQDWAPALFWLAWYRHERSDTRETLRDIRPLLEGAALKGHPAAQMMLGRFLAHGKFGVREIPAGWKWLRRLASSVSAESGGLTESPSAG